MYSAEDIAVGMGTTALIDATAFMPIITHIMLTNGKFKLEVPVKVVLAIVCLVSHGVILWGVWDYCQ